MPERILKCPECAAPLAPPSRFARSVVCEYCNATVQLDPSVVSAARFRDAFREWSAGDLRCVTVGGVAWRLGVKLADGEIADVWLAERARWPTERVVLKVLRRASDADRFEREWEALTALQSSTADGADRFTRRLPQPVAHCAISGALGASQAILLRQPIGFRKSFADVQRAFPGGVDPEAAMRRRT
jgi:hypothetical protein